MDHRKVHVSFEEVAVYFSDEEWQQLEVWQKEFYNEVMQDILETLLSLEDNLVEGDGKQNSTGYAVMPQWSNDKGAPVTAKQIYDQGKNLNHRVQEWEGLAPPDHKDKVWSDGQYPLLQDRHNCMLKILYQCIECKEIFSSQSLFDAHMIRHTASQAASSYKYSQVDFLGASCLTALPGREMYETRSNLVDVSAHAAEENWLRCLYCTKHFSDLSILMEHERSHKESKAFICSECGKSFHRHSILKVHQRIHTGERPYACPDCGRRFSQRFNVIIHQRIHTGERPYQCPKCNKSFRYQTTLLRHEMAKCVGIIPTTYPLQKAKNFQTLLLKNAQPLKVTQPTTIQPPLTSEPLSSTSLLFVSPIPKTATPCTLISSNKSTGGLAPPLQNTYRLKNHINVPATIPTRGPHPIERQYRCGHCNKYFVHWKQLKEHQKLHVDAQNLCTVCNKSFCRRSTLLIHQRTHTGEKPYTCNECGKKFSQRFNLVIHQRIHSDEKPYECHKCGKDYRYRTALLRHQRNPPCAPKQSSSMGTHNVTLLPSLKNNSVKATLRSHGELPSSANRASQGSANIKQQPIDKKTSFPPTPQLKKHGRKLCPECGQTFTRTSKCTAETGKGGTTCGKCGHCGKALNLPLNPGVQTIIHTENTSYKHRKLQRALYHHESKALGTLAHKNMLPPFSYHASKTIVHKPSLSPPTPAQKPCTKKWTLPARTRGKNANIEQYKRDLNKYRKRKKKDSKSWDKCAYCGRGFSRKHEFEIHLRSHTGEKPFVCEKCGRAFSQRSNLLVHERLHTGEKPYKCPECDEGFRYRRGLQKHQERGFCM
ncbi:zinc finger protein 436 [Xenopus laevis]|uniref:Zinc finger protein 436 n=2 Tax=Xenopus laevis TaxID=8355 RepID=A0A1L8FUP3_XENLA|nr:zinc finger protein 436 [Xenopus laevis]XP_018122476.1 zinc finger protein 436 [Xenopus laevis]OCT75322.1 hypothetical protein XELAEV_18030501mg [Xenopus laevis]